LEICHVVRIRLSRLGRPHRPFYRINAVDSRVKRDGAVLENLGWYDPCAEKTKQFELNSERIKHWLEHGAQPSETLMDLFAKHNLVDAAAWGKTMEKRIEAKKKASAAKAAAGADKKDTKK